LARTTRRAARLAWVDRPSDGSPDAGATDALAAKAAPAEVTAHLRRVTSSRGDGVDAAPRVSIQGGLMMSALTLSVAGKSALVTGAFGDLGRHFARTLATAGARVALAGRRLAEGEKLAQRIVEQGGHAVVVPLDVSDPASVAAAIEQSAAALGPITVVVNNAGIAVTKPVLDQTEDDWLGVIDVNLNGAWRVAQAAARHMTAHGLGGSIINIASILGLRVSAQVPAYVASKAGLIHLTQALALELARHNIRVNALAPGYIETDINRDFFASDAGQALIKRVPQRRLGKPEHLDGPLLLLASDASEFMTGTTVVVDGGHVVNAL
jgi:NAD(P)-dependent dehydrogenase (short-subunit alcohol dehydrogenase family)